ncbi:carbohydrate ABC transporter permease [Lacrimispora sp.]|uniref:carbohydrate ABC transporter permease n=1 Tax=Lacrimispora sp. TaxID=2719234 RepID=UPI00346019E3
MDKREMEVSKTTGTILTIGLTALSLGFLFPVVLVLINSFKSKLFISNAPFQLPNGDTYVGLANYTEGIRKTGLLQAFGRSLFITVASVAVIILFTSMTAWFITRVKSVFTSLLYYVFVFAMIVPFQMVMFTMSKTANDLYLNSMYGLVLLYLGFGAGQAVFLFCGFVKAIPLEIEEAAMIDGCSPLQTYVHVVFPMLKPTAVTVAILNSMWIWNDYLLPSLILPQEKGTIPMVIQNLKGGYGSIDMGAMMAMLVLAILPIVVFYLSCQKYIIKGVAAGAVKG